MYIDNLRFYTFYVHLLIYNNVASRRHLDIKTIITIKTIHLHNREVNRQHIALVV
jgi:hypothetical protein